MAGSPLEDPPPVSTPALVRAFYERIWNAGDLAVADELLAPDLVFRGSLGVELRGRDAFLDYVRSTLTSLSGYLCELVTCVAEADQAFARMRFSGRHTGSFRGFAPTGLEVSWVGAALFRCSRGVIVEVWVLGDLAGLDMLLARQAATRPATDGRRTG
jgi:predicted ester cyclase